MKNRKMESRIGRDNKKSNDAPNFKNKPSKANENDLNDLDSWYEAGVPSNKPDSAQPVPPPPQSELPKPTETPRQPKSLTVREITEREYNIKLVKAMEAKVLQEKVLFIYSWVLLFHVFLRITFPKLGNHETMP